MGTTRPYVKHICPLPEFIFALLTSAQKVPYYPGMDISHDTRRAIKQCGTIAGVHAEAMKKWFQRGVPGRWHLVLLRVARENNIELSEDDLIAASGGK